MSDLCASCRRPLETVKNRNQCGLCQHPLCKDCTQFLDPSEFSFLKTVPEDLAHSTYCGPCYDEKAAPALASYVTIMDRAREIGVFYKNERNLPSHRSSNRILKVENCPDRKETLLRLAFFAAEMSYNALVNVELTSRKVKTAGYQTTLWNGTGFPAHLKL
jgi:hypothetical protein